MKDFTRVVLFLSFAAVVSAAVTVNFDNTNTQSTTALTGFSTYGDDMAGLVATIFPYAPGESAVWAVTGPGAGAAAGTGWTLSQSGDTFSNSWRFSTTRRISRLLIDAGPGDSVFDAIAGSTVTPGSADGKPFQLTSAYNGNISATYRAPVGVGANAPLYDLYRYLDIQFSGGFSGSISFLSDTDSLKFSGDINPVPAPGALFLSGIGTFLVSFLRRR